MARFGRVRLGALMRMTAVRLSAIYLAVFAVFAVVLVVYVTATATSLLQSQSRETIDAEITDLARIYRAAGIVGLVRSVERRARQPGASLYLVTEGTGRILAGNVEALEPGGPGQRRLHRARLRLRALRRQRLGSLPSCGRPNRQPAERHAHSGRSRPDRTGAIPGTRPARLDPGARPDGGRRAARLAFRRPPGIAPAGSDVGFLGPHPRRRPEPAAARDRSRRRIRPPVRPTSTRCWAASRSCRRD